MSDYDEKQKKIVGNTSGLKKIKASLEMNDDVFIRISFVIGLHHDDIIKDVQEWIKSLDKFDEDYPAIDHEESKS